MYGIIGLSLSLQTTSSHSFSESFARVKKNSVKKTSDVRAPRGTLFVRLIPEVPILFFHWFFFGTHAADFAEKQGLIH